MAGEHSNNYKSYKPGRDGGWGWDALAIIKEIIEAIFCRF